MHSAFSVSVTILAQLHYNQCGDMEKIFTPPVGDTSAQCGHSHDVRRRGFSSRPCLFVYALKFWAGGSSVDSLNWNCPKNMTSVDASKYRQQGMIQACFWLERSGSF